MKVQICAVGKMRAGAERELLDDYLARFDRTGRNLGLGPVEVIEVEAKKPGKAEEAALLLKTLPKNPVICAMDERGRVMTSPQFARMMADVRDAGNGDLCFVIGGADGLDHDLRQQAAHVLSFGKMVWPHMLARVMLAEQLYRGASILAGLPYHRV